MWCPQCGDEYREGYTRCPDCDVDLVAEPPLPTTAPIDTRDHELVEYDLSHWDAAQIEALDRWLAGDGIPVTWEPGGILVGPRSRRVEIDQLLALLEAPPVAPEPGSGRVVPVSPGGGLLASRWRRLWSAMLDGLILSAVFVPVNLGLGPSQATRIFGTVLGAVYEITLIANRGRTVGCMALGIQIVRRDEVYPPGWQTATIRWFVPAAVGLLELVVHDEPVLTLLGMAWAIAVYAPILGRQRRGLHDRAAGTDVISTR